MIRHRFPKSDFLILTKFETPPEQKKITDTNFRLLENQPGKGLKPNGIIRHVLEFAEEKQKILFKNRNFGQKFWSKKVKFWSKIEIWSAN